MDAVLKKLQYKPDIHQICLAVNAPTKLSEAFANAGFVVHLAHDVQADFTILFVHNKAEFEQHVSDTVKQIAYDSLFWLAYPKGSSKLHSDINRDSLWKLMESYSLRPVRQVAIDDDWSALRFRPPEKVK